MFIYKKRKKLQFSETTNLFTKKEINFKSDLNFDLFYFCYSFHLCKFIFFLSIVKIKFIF